jgi:hypothetical protein
MEAMTSCSARRVRALAVVAVLLCGLATLAPLIARSTGVHHQRIHVVKIVGVAAGDHHTTTLRLDQPVTLVQHSRSSTNQVATTRAAAAATPTDDTTLDSVRTRGPPTSAL